MPRASRADLSSFASKVAQHLSGDWSSDYLSHPTYPDQFPRAEYIWDMAMVQGAISTYVLDHDAILTGPDGIRLYVIDRPLHPEQFLVGAFAPDELKETYFWSKETPNGIAVSSNPARAAHQITQRLLPRYEQAVARTEPPFLEHAAEHGDRTADQAQAANPWPIIPDLGLPPMDYRTEGYVPATDQIADELRHLLLCDEYFAVRAEYHSPDERHSFWLLFDKLANYDAPGTAEYVTLHLTRDLEGRTFDFWLARHPLIPLAQNWLIREGCPTQSALQSHQDRPPPADAATTRLEEQLRSNAGDRYELLDHYTSGSPDLGIQVQTLLYDRHPEAESAPYRLFLEDTPPSLQTYTLRELSFATAAKANAWARHRHRKRPMESAPASRASRPGQTDPSRVATQTLAAPPAPVTSPRPSATPPLAGPRSKP